MRAAHFKALYRNLEGVLSQIERIENTSMMLEKILEALLSRFEHELGFVGARLYRRDRDGYRLCCGFGASHDAPAGLLVPRDYPPHVRTLAEGLLVMRRDELGFDERFERSIGVTSPFAAIAVGEGNSHVIAFSVRGEVREEQIVYSLTAVRHAINLKLRQRKISGMLEESRVIQEIILPTAAPAFEGYDLAGRSRSADIVGGDLYDYLSLDEGVLGVAIADSSGHGLPAALLARDVITGLRMGLGRASELARTLERLNRVIHRAALSTKFVSLFCGELHRDGSLVYCNAGHNPPLLKRGTAFQELDRGGMVLGPLPAARFESSRVDLETGDLILLFTDGVIEREDTRATPFGVDRLKSLLRDLGGAGASEVVEAVHAAVEDYGSGVPPEDDVTVVAVRRT